MPRCAPGPVAFLSPGDRPLGAVGSARPPRGGRSAPDRPGAFRPPGSPPAPRHPARSAPTHASRDPLGNPAAPHPPADPEGERMTDVYILDAIRTPFGRYGGALAGVRPDDLAAGVLNALQHRNDLD